MARGFFGAKHLSPAYENIAVPAMPGGMAQIWGWGGDVSVEELVLHEAFWAEAHPDEERVALDITEQVLTALETLHGAGHIHADLHMGNMMVHTSRRGRKIVNLIDLGCCTPVGERFARWATKPGEIERHYNRVAAIKIARYKV